ncbi:NAD-dependent epimerase/dehydratase family protein [Arthrobacter sp. AK01]|uniref:NAD-dependent epimerase/dehydratase family protein n=1 Tax=Micrococcaceae TaxID=1268 RepID=UPI001E4FBB2E|nr:MULTISPECIES: NAD-dependent epimerase/dehydratase family protein [Micrococcaceae]MCD4849436.1 NAD-dependent epimerase/dehydratase family protein [Arthrobacter sp. AK01]MCP1410935.1 nucleoside-diphosphate-sugar epimerase [Paenarthrobacter sp. A20]
MYVVTGAGPVGYAVAEQLARQGHQVRVLTRSGSGPEHPLVERVQADVSDASQLDQAIQGATAVFHCIHGSAYRASAWAAELPQAEQVVMDAAAAAGAVVVFPESLYSYSEPDNVMTEAGPRTATGGKRGVRTALLTARKTHAADTVSVVAGDFFGPRVKMAHAGERMVAPILAGKAVQFIGSTRQPHSFTYVPDLAAAMIAAAQKPKLWNTVLHAPTGAAVTQGDMAAAHASAAGVAVPKVSAVPGWVLRVAGVFSTDMREIAELLYQFERPFVMDSSESQKLLGLEPTPLMEAATATMTWWKEAARMPQRS